MKVYKFGGASVRSAEGVRNLARIAGKEGGGMLVIVSAMGKTTNALEKVVALSMEGDREGALAAAAESRAYHASVAGELFADGRLPERAEGLFGELEGLLATHTPEESDYDEWYDRIVSYGELLSTSIISAYMELQGMANRLLDMRRLFVTDGRHRDADINLDASTPLLREAVAGSGLCIGQGFIAGGRDGSVVTLGREGSDYSAAAAGYMLDAESVTIWKDVDGILNADPKLFPDTVLIPELTYLDAVELAYSGAQVIHPKTIKPLQNKDIKLYVRPFGDDTKPGSVIRGEIARPISIPILILRKNQVLVSIRPNDFAFVLEEKFSAIFALMESCGVKANLIQSSAVNLSICVDRARLLPELEERLAEEGYRVVYNDNMELLTVRGYTPELYEKYASAEDVYLVQQTRRTLRIVRKAKD